MRGLEPNRYLPLLITQSSLSATGVLEILLAKLGERPRFKRSTNLLALEKHLADIEPMTLVLVLDDAQNYPSAALEELRMLLGLGGRTRSAFALILLGDDYLLGSLRLSIQRALFSRISAAHQLHALPREDIAPYLNWHLARAGPVREIFAPAAIDLLAEASEGNPRTLNLLAQAAWLASARTGASDIQHPPSDPAPNLPDLPTPPHPFPPTLPPPRHLPHKGRVPSNLPFLFPIPNPQNPIRSFQKASKTPFKKTTRITPLLHQTPYPNPFQNPPPNSLPSPSTKLLPQAPTPGSFPKPHSKIPPKNLPKPCP
jgi:hypothetical protein